MKGGKFTVTTTPQIILGGQTGNTAYPSSGILSNPSGGATVYLGGQDLDTSTHGFPLLAGTSIEVDVVVENLYAMVAASTVDIYYLKRGD